MVTLVDFKCPQCGRVEQALPSAVVQHRCPKTGRVTTFLRSAIDSSMKSMDGPPTGTFSTAQSSREIHTSSGGRPFEAGQGCLETHFMPARLVHFNDTGDAA